MKIMVTGAGGQLGYDVVRRLNELRIPCCGVDRADFDLTDESAVSGAIDAYAPDAVVHCAAFTAVEQAETAREDCYRINVLGTRHVAQACARTGARLAYISTDYVFAGQGDAPFEPGDAKAPSNYYGESKLLGEEEVLRLIDRHFIVRTSWVFGLNGRNFVRTMLRLGAEKPFVTVVSDQIGSPTYTVDLARLLCDMVQTEKYGVYHATNESYCSWYDFACAIMREAQLSCEVRPVTSEEYNAAVRRPKNSRLSKLSLDRAGFARLPAWPDALRRYLAELRANEQ